MNEAQIIIIQHSRFEDDYDDESIWKYKVMDGYET